MMKNQLHPIIQCACGVDQQARWTGVPKNTVQINILVVMRLFPHTPLCISTRTQLTCSKHHGLSLHWRKLRKSPDVAPIINEDLTPASVFMLCFPAVITLLA